MDLGAYPALVEGGATAVAGEIYEIDPDLLPILDEFEDCPRLYRRVPVELADGGTAAAYVMRRERLASRHKPVPGGDWLARPEP